MLHPSFLLDHLSQTGPHQEQIEKIFKQNMCWKGTSPVIPYPLIVLAFTNRSGSNLLAEMIKSTGKLIGLGEALNADTVRTRALNWNIQSFPDYFHELSKRHKLPFGVKASWDQLLMLLRCNIPAMYTGLQVIHIHRYDVVSQGISLQIAWQTKKWTSLTTVKEDIFPRYDAHSITSQISATQIAESMFPLIFEAFEINVHHLSYETLTVTSREIVWLFLEQFGPEFVPVFHRLQGRP